jgi:hypothetical protein
VLAALLANFLAGVVRGATGSDLLSNVARYAIIVYAAFAAITELGVAVQLTAPTFLIVLGAVALAAAIAFGFGAQGVARDIVEKAYDERRDQARQAVQQGGGSSSGTSTGSAQPGDTGATTTIGDEDRPSARPLRRDE